MNNDEAIVKRFLENQFLKVTHEPDGNIPPDFLVNDEIAIEVRRLNQNYTRINGKIKGLEENRYPLRDKISDLLKKYGSQKCDHRWFVGVRFTRPLEGWGTLKVKITNILDAVKKHPPQKLQYLMSMNISH